MLERQPPLPDDRTRELGGAIRIAARLCALPESERDAAARAACGDDDALLGQVRSLLAGMPEGSDATFDGVDGDGADADTGAGAGIHEHERAALRGTFGRYELLDCIGTGGMGVVFRARQHGTGRLVAVKLLRLNGAGEVVLRRFRREARLLARLQHPGIAQVLDAGCAMLPFGKEPYLAMELVEGPTLLEGARELGLSIRARVVLLEQMCRAIAHAHGRGVIHRDLKPDNVRLSGAPDALLPRILDFGVATATAAGGTETTLATHVVGTLGYAAPEQIDGETDVRCDVYSLGAIGYELLTGHQPVPVRGLGALTAIGRIHEIAPPPASSHAPELRGDLDAVLAKALARDPRERYASADELGDDLHRWLHHRPVEARRATPLYLLSRFVRRNRALSAAAALLLACAAAGTGAAAVAFADARRAKSGFSALLSTTVEQLREQVAGAGRPRELPAGVAKAVAELVVEAPFDLDVRRVEAQFVQLEGDLARAHGQQQRALELRERLVRLRRGVRDAAGDHDARRELAIALVLRGDIAREGCRDLEGRLAASEDYETAHALHVELCVERPQDRRARDDLGHSFLRRAAVAFERGDDAAAAALLTQAGALAESLTRDHASHANTHRLWRDYLGLSAALAQRHDKGFCVMPMLQRMLEHQRHVRRQEPDNLDAAEFLLSTALACASAARSAGDAAATAACLREADEVAAFLEQRDPHNVFALDARIALREARATSALDAHEFADALRHVVHGTRDLQRLRDLDRGTDRAAARREQLVALATQALSGLDACDGDAFARGVAFARLLLPLLRAEERHAPDYAPLLAVLTMLGALVGCPTEAAR